MTEIEQKYLKAKESYYNQQPIMSDSEFDELEETLKLHKSKVTQMVGAFDRFAKIKHPSRMVSMQKIQADKINGLPPIDDFSKWVKSIVIPSKTESILAEFKLDGNAINLVYDNYGDLIYALSRGDGNVGRDYQFKLIKDFHCPFHINHIVDLHAKYLEVRCEAVIRKDTFACKYSKDFSNERNYVAGVLNSDNSSVEAMREIDLIPVDIRVTKEDGSYDYYDTVAVYKELGFTKYDDLMRMNCYYNVADSKHIASKFQTVFNEFKEKRNSYPYRTDGIVFKFDVDYRRSLGETDHHPNWAMAVKFKPEENITDINGTK